MLASVHDARRAPDRAVAVALEYLRQVGIDCHRIRPKTKCAREYEKIWSQLGSRTIEDVADLPLMSDPESLGDARRADKPRRTSRYYR